MSLCPEFEKRAAMTDDEFWQHVADNLSRPTWDHDDAGPEITSLDAAPCPVCGESGACSYDFEGRALIHTTEDDDA